MIYDSTEPGVGEIAFAEQQANGTHAQLAGAARGGSDGVLLRQIDEASEQVTNATHSGRAGKVHVKSKLQPQRGRSGKAIIKNALPKEADLVVDYSQWSPNSKKGLRAWIEQGDTKTKVKVQLK